MTQAPSPSTLLFVRISDISIDELEEIKAQYCTREEIARVTRFHHLEDQKRAVGSIYLQKFLCTKVAKCQINELEFGKNNYGKPLLVKPILDPQICYNVSHDGEYVIIGYSSVPIGIDVMDIRKDLEINDLKTQFSVTEWAKIMNSRDKMKCFYLLWCLKESYIKAVGSGMSIEPHRVAFEFCNNIISVYQDKVLQPYSFETFQMDEFHVCAVAYSALQIPADMIVCSSELTPSGLLLSPNKLFREVHVNL